MKIKPAPTHVQPLLLDVPPDKDFPNAASARTHYGKCAEEIVCHLLPATDIVNSGNFDVVYDLWAANFKSYLEVKNVHHGSSVPIYVWRRAKDREAVRQGHNLLYVFTIHKVRGVKSIRELWEAMAERLVEVRIVPFHVVNRACQGRTIVHNSGLGGGPRAGWHREGYCEGYQLLPVKTIQGMRYERPFTMDGHIHGLPFTVPTYIHRSITKPT